MAPSVPRASKGKGAASSKTSDSSHGRSGVSIQVTSPQGTTKHASTGSVSSSSSSGTADSSSTITPANYAARTAAMSSSSPANASISIREYIYMGLPSPLPPGSPVPYSVGLPDINPLKGPPVAFEPTSTLVLTSTTSTFVDIRIFKRARPTDPELPNTGGPRERLEWAFAGTSSSVEVVDPHDPAVQRGEPPQEGPFGPVHHSTWTHWLDSRYDVGATDIPTDSGLMYAISETETLEHGSGINVYNNKPHTYEELWNDVPLKVCFPSKNYFSIVLRLDAPAHNVRGLIVRVGQYCQGILMMNRKETATIERWQFEEEKNERGEVVKGNWKRVARIGDLFLPCATTFQPEILSVGGMVKYHDFEWTVEELVEWHEQENRKSS